MTNEEFELIKRIIDKDVKEARVEDLDKMLDYLINVSSKLKKYKLETSKKKSLIFESELIEKNSSIILKQINELMDLVRTDDEKAKMQRFLNVINRSAYKINEKVTFPAKAIKQKDLYRYDFDTRYFCIGHLIQLMPKDLNDLRGIGPGSINFINNILKENGLSLGTFVSSKDNDIINEIVTENVKIKMEKEREESYRKIK